MDDLLRFPGAVRRDPRIEAWFDFTDPLRLMTRTWLRRMRGCGADVRELLHDGRPVACVGDARRRFEEDGLRVELIDVHLADIATNRIGNRPDRVEPRAIKRRPKPHHLLTGLQIHIDGHLGKL